MPTALLDRRQGATQSQPLSGDPQQRRRDCPDLGPGWTAGATCNSSALAASPFLQSQQQSTLRQVAQAELRVLPMHHCTPTELQQDGRLDVGSSVSCTHLGVNFTCRPRRKSLGGCSAPAEAVAADTASSSSGEPARLCTCPSVRPLAAVLTSPLAVVAALCTAASAADGVAAVLEVFSDPDGTMWPTSSGRATVAAEVLSLCCTGCCAAERWCCCREGDRAGERECGRTAIRVGDARCFVPGRPSMNALFSCCTGNAAAGNQVVMRPQRGNRATATAHLLSQHHLLLGAQGH